MKKNVDENRFVTTATRIIKTCEKIELLLATSSTLRSQNSLQQPNMQRFMRKLKEKGATTPPQ